MATIVIINDGDVCWGARWDDLERAMDAQGWALDGAGLWREPSSEDHYEDGGAYTELCHCVDPAPGFRPEDFPRDTNGCMKFTWRPDLGAWELA